MLVSQPALAMGLGGTCMMYHEEILRKGRNIVSLNVDYNLTYYALKISHLFYTYVYKHNDIVSVESSSIVLYNHDVECLGGTFLRGTF